VGAPIAKRVRLDRAKVDVGNAMGLLNLWDLVLGGGCRCRWLSVVLVAREQAGEEARVQPRHVAVIDGDLRREYLDQPADEVEYLVGFHQQRTQF
jgi:hypothetical protein